jgi:hypothetical protein
VIKKVPGAPSSTELTAAPVKDSEMDVTEGLPSTSGFDRILAGLAAVVSLLSTLASFWAYTAMK